MGFIAHLLSEVNNDIDKLVEQARHTVELWIVDISRRICLSHQAHAMGSMALAFTRRCTSVNPPMFMANKSSEDTNLDIINYLMYDIYDFLFNPTCIWGISLVPLASAEPVDRGLGGLLSRAAAEISGACLGGESDLHFFFLPLPDAKIGSNKQGETVLLGLYAG